MVVREERGPGRGLSRFAFYFHCFRSRPKTGTNSTDQRPVIDQPCLKETNKRRTILHTCHLQGSLKLGHKIGVATSKFLFRDFYLDFISFRVILWTAGFYCAGLMSTFQQFSPKYFRLSQILLQPGQPRPTLILLGHMCIHMF